MPKDREVISIGKDRDLPSIQILFSESWRLFTNNILNLFLISLFAFLTNIALVVICILVVGAAGGFAMISKIYELTRQTPTSGVPDTTVQSFVTSQLSSLASLIPLLIVVGLIGLIGFIIVGTISEIASIIVVSDNKKGESLMNIIKGSFKLILPLFWVNTLVFLLVFGGFFVFIIPAVVFAFLFAFTRFETVLNNQKGVSALKRSVGVITHHFGPLLIRWLILIGIYIVIVVLIPNLLRNIDSQTSGIVGILQFFINMLLGWFALSYSVTMFRHASDRTDPAHGKNITWMWVIAGIGWIIFFFFLSAVVQFFTSGAAQRTLDSIQKSMMDKNIQYQYQQNGLPLNPEQNQMLQEQMKQQENMMKKLQQETNTMQSTPSYIYPTITPQYQ